MDVKMSSLDKFMCGVSGLLLLALTLVCLFYTSDTKTFDHDQLEQLKTHLEEKNYDWNEILE